MRVTRLLAVALCAALVCAALGNAADEWQALRLDHKDSLEKSLYQTEPYRCYFAGSVVYDFYQNPVTCKESDEYVDTTTYFALVDTAIATINNMLLVQRAPLQIALKEAGSPCVNFVLEPADVNRSDTDFILYQTYRPVGPNNDSLVSKVCSYDATTGRPTSGVINVAASYPTGTFKSVVEVTQELLHMLGFDTNVFTKNSMLTTATVRGVDNVPLVSSSKVLQMARDFYNCSSLPGMELDYDSTNSNAPLPYWRGRVAKDDVMSSMGNMTYITPMTIAAMEDTGFYKGNYATADIMPWGYKAGCDFVNQRCIQGGTSNFGNLFCTDGLSSSPTWHCTSDRRAIGRCGMTQASEKLPAPFQYFTSATEGGSLSTMDYCPVIQGDIVTSCIDGDQDALTGSTISAKSRCFDTEGTDATYESSVLSAACLPVSCDAASLTYTVSLSSTGTDQVNCPAGTTLDLSTIKGSVITKGTLTCPPYDEVCVQPYLETSGSNSGSHNKNNSKSDNKTDSAYAICHTKLMIAVMTAMMLWL